MVSSTDNTVSIIKNMVRGNYKLISEPDLGIYNAMNKGIGLASGRYLIFPEFGRYVFRK